nr:MAG TPA: hypothetical protein [Caudoviricetes sp.]
MCAICTPFIRHLFRNRWKRWTIWNRADKKNGLVVRVAVTKPF